jgi:hypothetical protein
MEGKDDKVYLMLMSAAKRLREVDIEEADGLREEAIQFAKENDVSKEALRAAAYL